MSVPSVTSSTSSVTVTVKFYVGGDGWGFADNQRLNYGGNFSGYTDFYNNGASQILVATKTLSVSTSYSSSVTRTATATLSGAYNGAVPTKSVTITVPRRPYAAPSAPTSPYISNISQGSARTNWTATSNWGGSPANRYRVEYEHVETGNTATITTANTYLDITPSVKGGTYRFRVQAYNDDLGNGGGTSSWSSWVTWTNPPDPPSVPTSVGVSNVTPTSARGAWSAPSNWGGQTGSYAYEFRNGTTVIKSGGPASSPQDISGLSPGTAYNFRVYALNDGGTSSWVQVNFTTQTGIASDTGTPSVTNVAVTTASASWSASSTANGGGTITYEWQVATDAGFTNVVKSGTTTGTNASITGLTAGTGYYFRVRPTTTYGAGNWKVSAQFTTKAGPVSTPVLSLVNPGPLGAALSWTAITDWGAQTGYYMLRYRVNGGAWTYVNVGTGTSYTFPTPLQPNAFYEVQVYGQNSYGDGPVSNTVSWTTDAVPVYYKVGGTWRASAAVYYKVAGTWRTVVRIWYKVGGTWR